MNLKGMKTSNPALSQFEQQSMSLGPVDEMIVDDSQRMTIEGTVNKLGLLFIIFLTAAAFSWQTMVQNPQTGYVLTFGGMFAAIVIGLVVSFKQNTAKVGSMLYAVAVGFFAGGLSAFMEAMYPGLVVQAVGLTLAVFFSMLFAYKTKLIQVTGTFKKVVVYATMGIMVFYAISLIASWGFGAYISYFDTENVSMLSLGLSIFICIIAALNLVLDFDFIERASEENTPKVMEWMGAFVLLVTIVWLYIELLRLLAKLRE